MRTTAYIIQYPNDCAGFMVITNGMNNKIARHGINTAKMFFPQLIQ